MRGECGFKLLYCRAHYIFGMCVFSGYITYLDTFGRSELDDKRTQPTRRLHLVRPYIKKDPNKIGPCPNMLRVLREF